MIELSQLHALATDLTLLYVEPAGPQRDWLEGVLWRVFAEVRGAESAATGLAAWQGKRPDLLLIDVAPPARDGLTLAAEVKGRAPDQLVVLLVPQEDPDCLKEGALAGVDGYVLKPIQQPQLLAVLGDAIRRVRTLREGRHYRLRAEQMEQRLFNDPLTGLGNRAALERELEHDGEHTLLLLHLDNLRRIQSDYGIEMGQLVLRAFAELLRKRFPKHCALHCLEGGWFAIALRGAALDELSELAQGLHRHLAAHHLPLEEGISARAAVTMAAVSGGGAGLLQEAHNALLEARRVAPGQLVVTRGKSPSTARRHEMRRWIRRIQEALRHDTLRPYYQPIVRNADGRVEKFECLARIIEGGEIIAPERFIAPARMAGLLPELTQLILRHAAEAFRGSSHQFSINISEEELRGEGFADGMAKTVAGYGIEPRRVVFEVLEQASIEGNGAISGALRRLKELGFRLAIDDFGAEHSNFARILDLEADYLKIDGRFIRDIHHDEKSRKVVGAIVQLAREIGCETVAEYVHCREVQEVVVALGIDYSQGDHCGEPRPIP